MPAIISSLDVESSISGGWGASSLKEAIAPGIKAKEALAVITVCGSVLIIDSILLERSVEFSWTMLKVSSRVSWKVLINFLIALLEKKFG